jgi:D,D-heptose 1,7-bisphosphate phosphatase
MVYHSEFGLVDSPQHPDEFELLPGVPEALRAINRLGFLAVVVSNQPGIAKGKCTPALLKAITEKMNDQLHACSARLDGIYFCLHHPEAQVEQYRLACECRKPSPGLLRRAASDLGIDLAASYIIGDGLTDVLAGKALGCRTILVGNLKCELCRPMDELDARPDFVATSVLDAANIISREVVAGVHSCDAGAT